MRTAIWLYLFLFIAFFDLHAQHPILTPYAISLGAAPSFIGLMMGIYSMTHLPGNLMASVYVDRFGSRLFIVGSLLFAGVVLVFQASVTNAWQLLILRSIAGFVIAFLSPACLALLARISSDISVQGKLMAGNGLVHTLASVLSPAAGAFIVAKVGFSATFHILGWILIITALLALVFIKDQPKLAGEQAKQNTINTPHHHTIINEDNSEHSHKLSWNIFILPVGLSCALGILSFEIPLLVQNNVSIMKTGLLFAVISIGSLITLSMLFINKFDPAYRTIVGSFLLMILYFILSIDNPIPFTAILLCIGMCKGIVFPALSHWLIVLSNGEKFGRTFSILAIATSIGAFLGPFLAGQLRDYVSSYFIAFVMLAFSLCFNTLPPRKGKIANPKIIA